MQKLLITLCISFLVVSCGYVSKSTLHTRQAQAAVEHSQKRKLPAVAIRQGVRTLAYKHRIGYPPMPGGYLGSLLAEDGSIVKVEMVPQGRGHDTYLTGLRPGVTTIHYVNGLVSPQYNRENLNGSAPFYKVSVTP